jgi:MOSC domain-containing protein
MDTAESELMAHVARINLTVVKGLALQHPDTVELTAAGAVENRRFYLISNGRLYNGKDHGPLVSVEARLEAGTLTLSFPAGRTVSGEVVLGERVVTDFWGRPVSGSVVEGPWAEALSAFTGDAVRLVRTDRPGEASDVSVGTILGRASCERLAEELGVAVDPRRFRMLLELDGLDPHEEDRWRARRLRVGQVIVAVGGPVPRCAVTTQDPDSGVVTLDTLRGIKDYRGLREGRWIDFGVYFDVEQAGEVHVGDAVELLPASVDALAEAASV